MLLRNAWLSMTSYVIPPAPQASVPVTGTADRFPVHRIYCVGRNYAEHAKEMGFTGREPPFFFMKPADAVLPVAAGETGRMPYPTLTANLHHEIELVVAIGKGGAGIKAQDALQHIWGYAVGLDMTRRDLQNDMKKQGRPWCIGKGFEASAPIGPITPVAQAGDVEKAAIWLQVNGTDRQRSNVDAAAGRPDLHRHARRRGRGGARRCAGRRHRRPGLPARRAHLTATTTIAASA
jgi:fumarylpyruvate hydrolase